MFYDNFVKLCNNVNKAPSAVAAELGLSRASVNGWKNGKIPTDANQLRIAQYFNVTVDYLLGNDIKKEPLVNDDQELTEYLEELKNRKEMRMLFSPAKGATKEEVLKLIEFSDGEFQIAIMLAAYLGLSRSEICGLCIKDCKEEVHIEKAVVQDENNNWVTKQPKEFSRYRTIVLPDIIKEKINELNKKDDDKLIEITPNAIGRRFDRLTQKVCGKRYGFHALRHYNVSVMLALNVPSKYIIDRTGHSTMRMVDRVYGHAISAKQKEVSSKITDYFENIQHEIQHEIILLCTIIRTFKEVCKKIKPQP